MSYLTFKALHILGVVLFLGSILFTAWWKLIADRTRDPRVIAFAQRQVARTDWVFTASGALILLIGGHAAIWWSGMDLRNTPWLFTGDLLFILSGLIWLSILVPVQRAQARLAREFADGGEIPDRYWRLCRIWNIVGTVATLLPLAVIYFMVFKPV